MPSIFHIENSCLRVAFSLLTTTFLKPSNGTPFNNLLHGSVKSPGAKAANQPIGSSNTESKPARLNAGRKRAAQQASESAGEQNIMMDTRSVFLLRCKIGDEIWTPVPQYTASIAFWS
ncbi:unnamed protein product [Protopolystoma xenopodis]|uniref:Uncharacterized protein n=1 Tax=Protopolystoma xenopodis TaxID=117903 RepID=A0A448XCE9_9PLAT|nr:unnamed protein product [Protopolystoma xenopodis]